MRIARTRFRMFAAVATAAALAGALDSLGDDYSVDPTSPEAPFTYATGDVVNQNGTGVNLAAALLGIGLADNVDAVSYGDDQVEPGGRENIVNFDFSVDRTSIGGGGIVSTEAAGNGAAGDKFRIIAFKNGRTVGPQRYSDSVNHGLTPKSGGTTESDIDAMSLPAGTKMPVYFSLDRTGSATLPTVGPSDIMYVQQPGVTPPTVFATAAQLGLAAGDNIDAMCIMDVGAVGQLDARDLVYVSFDRASPTRAANFGNGTDGVLRIWPRPFKVIYKPTQLDLAPAAPDELDAMTARDPGPGSPFGMRTGLPPRSPAAALTDKAVAKIPTRGYRDLKFGVQIAYDPHAGEDREPGVRFKGTKDESAGFTALPFASTGDLSVHLSGSYKLSKGLQSGLSNWGCEVDFDTTPGTIPTRFLYVGIVYYSDGLGAFVNDSRTNVGTPQTFVGAKELELSLILSASLGADVSARVPGGDWKPLFRNPTYQLGSTLTAGFGASRLGKGSQVSLSNIDVEGDLYPEAFPYTRPLEWGGIDLGRASWALDPAAAPGADPDFSYASMQLANFLGKSLGTPPGPKRKARSTTKPFADGLVLEIRDQMLGSLPSFVPAKKASATLLKAARFAEQAQKQVTKSKPNAKSARKLIAKALAAVDDTREILIFGKNLR